jgi:hypothetical protein
VGGGDSPAADPAAAEGPGRTADVQILITRIELRDLKNTGSVLDPQDPCVHIQVGGGSYQSKRKTDAGTNATFDEEITLDVTDDEIAGTVCISSCIIVCTYACM